MTAEVIPSYQYPHLIPTHTHITNSPLSKESPEQNYRGFIHLAILLLVVNNLRLVFENYIKYGVLLDVPLRTIPASDYNFYILNLILLLSSSLYGLLLEKQMYKLQQRKQTFAAKLFLVYLNPFLMLLISAWLSWKYIFHFTVGCFALMSSMIVAMKMLSFHFVNSDLRNLYFKNMKEKKEDNGKNIYPNNLSVSNFLYFLVAPTLCYQTSYPRTPAVRPLFALKRFLELISAMLMVYFMTEQYSVPTVRNSFKSFEDMQYLVIIERVLKLSVTSLYTWLLLFYAFFHSFLNLNAELLRFGDRSFYQAWWNAATIKEYWRLWNTPVHSWLKRHVFTPVRLAGYSSTVAQLVVFLLSAFFHEFLISVPTHVIQGWAFAGMIGQIPLITFTDAYKMWRPKSSLGNYIFWICFCIVGQPICVLLYYRAWAKTNAEILV